MSAADWVKLIAEILKLIADGMSKNDAVAKMARKYGVSESSIWSKGGF